MRPGSSQLSGGARPKKNEMSENLYQAPLQEWQDEDELPLSEWSMLVDESGPELPPTKGSPQAFWPPGTEPQPTTSQKRSSTGVSASTQTAPLTGITTG